MPARYYKFTAPAGDTYPLVEFFALDSNPLAAVSDLNPEFWQIPYAKKQAKWLDVAMQDSQAPWKIAFAHHPYLSNGRHGNAGMYDGFPGAGIIYYDFLTRHVCDRADLMLSGHDHELQWLHANKNCGKTQHIVSGAGAKTRQLKDTKRNKAYWQKGGVLGFFHITIHGDRLQGTVYTVDKVSGEYTEAFLKTIIRK